MANPGHEVARGAIANILKERGLEPARNRETTRKEILSRHSEVIAADFFTFEVWTRPGLTRFIVLFLIDLSRRRVEIGGIAARAEGIWMGPDVLLPLLLNTLAAVQLEHEKDRAWRRAGDPGGEADEGGAREIARELGVSEEPGLALTSLRSAEDWPLRWRKS